MSVNVKGVVSAILTGVVALAFSTALFAQTVEIPRAAYVHKRIITQQARLIWGLDAPTATFAAQIHQESLWRADAVSSAGARGLAQFMPSTGDWIVTVYKSLGEHEPENPTWAIRAMITYDLHLYRLVDGANNCERFAKALSAYNGGLTWVSRDEALASAAGVDTAYWFGGVESYSARASWAKAENRNYTRRILTELEPAYIAAGFGGGMCTGKKA